MGNRGQRFSTPDEMKECMIRYLNSLRTYKTEKLRDSNAGDYLEKIADLNDKPMPIWIKAPSCMGFADFAGFNIKTYKKWRERPGYDEVCQWFEEQLDIADHECLYDRDKMQGARFRLTLRNQLTPTERQKMEIEKSLANSKISQDEKKGKTIDLKNKLLELQIQKMEENGQVDPEITKLIKEININGESE